MTLDWVVIACCGVTMAFHVYLVLTFRQRALRRLSRQIAQKIVADVVDTFVADLRGYQLVKLTPYQGVNLPRGRKVNGHRHNAGLDDEKQE